MVTASFSPLPDPDRLALRWQALEARAGQATSFFLGWTWTAAWLESYGVRPDLLAVVDEDGQDVALALVGRAMDHRLLGRVATISLNQSGDTVADRPYIEYNGLLIAQGAEEVATAAAIGALARRRDWRALRLGGLVPGAPLLAIAAHRRVRMDSSPVYQVDLDAVRGAGGDYLSLLSANSRSQIRRAMKEHDDGLPTVLSADSVDQASDWLAAMAALNRGRHADNAWDDDGFRRFVRALAARGMPDGGVELLRLSSGDDSLGYLLTFVHRGVAMNYQSAFVAPRSGKDKPGLLCHAAAIRHYAAQGLARYSLLAGKDRYKQSLATCQEELEWWSIERFSPRLEGEALLRRLFRRPVSA